VTIINFSNLWNLSTLQSSSNWINPTMTTFKNSQLK